MLNVEIVNDDEQFCALEPEWRNLVSQCPDVPYFLTWEFISLRWKYFAAGRELWILTARTDAGILIGIAPWVVAESSVGPIKVRRLEFLCRVEIPFRFERYELDGENLDIIAHPDHRDAVTALFLKQVERSQSQWDVVDLAWLSPDSRLPSHFTSTRSLVFNPTSPCVTATLPEEWSTYEQTTLGKSESKRIRRFARRLERDYPGQVAFHRINERDEVTPAMDSMDRMKARRWADQGQLTPSEEDAHELLHKHFGRDFADAAFDRGWLRFYQLRIGEDITAAVYCIVHHNIDYLINKGFDPAWKRFAPGNVLQAYEIEQTIAEGVGGYDFGHGWVEAKSMWGNAEREDVRMIASTGWKGHSYLARKAIWFVARSHGRRLGQRLMPEPMYLWLSQVVKKLRRSSINSTSNRDSGTASSSDQ